MKRNTISAKKKPVLTKTNKNNSNLIAAELKFAPLRFKFT